MRKIELSREPLMSAKQHAFVYQTEAVNAVKDLEYAAIFHEQGLGKSKIAIDLMLYWFTRQQVDSVIILTKKALINNWQQELDFHTHLKPKVITTDKNKNYYVFNSSSRVILCNFELMISEMERIRLFQKTRSVAIIIDESTKIKNPDSTITKTLFDLSSGFVKRIIMTGTPIANRPYDIWAQIFFLDNGISLGTNFLEFKHKTDLTNDLQINSQKQKAFEECIRSIFNKIDKFSIRETKDGSIITLPAKQYHRIITQWEQHQLDLYNQIKDELRVKVVKNEKAEIDESDVVLKRLLRLVQAASNPSLIDESYDQQPGKVSYLESLLSTIISNGEKAIVWTCFTQNVDWLAKHFKQYNTVRVHGKMNIEDRNRSIDQFKTKEEVKILVATPAAAKEGLTLTVANHVIFYDRGFSLDDYLQAQDRIHRISQHKICHVYNLIMNESIDEWVDALLKSKQTAAKLSQGDIDYETYKSTMDYSFGDIIQEILLQ
jgi:SNF2 family DNA or RNA helicase